MFQSVSRSKKPWICWRSSFWCAVPGRFPVDGGRWCVFFQHRTSCAAHAWEFLKLTTVPWNMPPYSSSVSEPGSLYFGPLERIFLFSQAAALVRLSSDFSVFDHVPSRALKLNAACPGAVFAFTSSVLFAEPFITCCWPLWPYSAVILRYVFIFRFVQLFDGTSWLPTSCSLDGMRSGWSGICSLSGRSSTIKSFIVGSNLSCAAWKTVRRVGIYTRSSQPQDNESSKVDTQPAIPQLYFDLNNRYIWSLKLYYIPPIHEDIKMVDLCWMRRSVILETVTRDVFNDQRIQ